MAKNQTAQVGFDGRITDLRIWDDVRTTAEIQTNISSVLTGSEAGLAALYTMSEGSGTTLDDKTNNNNDGIFYEGQTSAIGFGQLANVHGPRWTSDVNAVFPEFTTHFAISATERSTGIVSDINARIGNGSDDAGITYSLSGTDASFFSINASTGELSTNTNLDFDYPVDANGDNVYELLVTATAGSISNTKIYGYSASDADCSVDYKAPANAGGSGYTHTLYYSFFQSFQPCSTGEMGFLRLNATRASSTGSLVIYIETSSGPRNLVSINLSDVDWNPSNGNYNTYTIIDLAEYTAQQSFPDIFYEGNNYMIGVGGAEAVFGFQPNTRPGKLYGSTLLENNDYDLIFEMDVIETENNAPTFMSATAVDFNENATGTVINVDAREEYNPNGSHTLGTPVDLNITYTLSGADASQFEINANNGVLTFINQPDFEAPADADGNNVYEITVTADDGLSTQQNITITVTDGAEAAIFTSSASVTLEENHTGTVLDVDAIAFGETDPAVGITYSISGGSDLDDFEINNASGVLTFVNIPDFENPSDANTDNIYAISVTASDGAFNTTQEITVEITNGDDVPVFTSGTTASFVENGTGVVYTATATDLESTPTFSITQGGDNDLFNLSSVGELTFKAAPDFEIPEDGNSDNHYEIEILATDDANQSTSLMLIVSVTDATEAPTDIFLDNTIIGSNNSIGQIVGTLSAQSQDASPTITFALTSGFGDNSSFLLDGDKLKAAEVFNASVKSSYSIQIRAFDVDNNDFTKELTITVKETIFDPNALVVSSGASDGTGSLRAAIVAAELNPGKDIINITSGAGTISLTAQLPDITQD
jgi:serralysin